MIFTPKNATFYQRKHIVALNNCNHMDVCIETYLLYEMSCSIIKRIELSKQTSFVNLNLISILFIFIL